MTNAAVDDFGSPIVSYNKEDFAPVKTGREYFREWVRQNGGADEVAKRLGYTPGAVRHWCNGRREISPERAVDLELKTNGELDRVILIFGTEFLGR